MTDDEGKSGPTEPTDGEREARSAETPDTDRETPTVEGGNDGVDEDKRPEIEDDERADLDLSEVDLEVVDGDEDDQEGSDDNKTPDDSDSSSENSSPKEGNTWGDMYVDTLAVILIAIIDEYGDGEREMDSDDIVELANQQPIALNEQADRVMEEMGGTRDLPPGQALVVGSAVVGSTMLLRETDVAGDVVGELTDGFGGEAA